MGSGERSPLRPDEVSDRYQLLTRAFRDNRLAMYALARRICGDDHAADAVQDVFLRVWRDDAHDSTRSTLRSYLLMMTRSVSIDIVRRVTAQRLRDERHVRTDRHLPDDADLHLFRNHARVRVEAALGELNTNERIAIQTAFFEHATYREIAARLGIPEGTVKSRIRLAMIKLRHHLRDLADDQLATPGLRTGD